MTPKLIKDLREALQESARESVEIEDPQTHEIYVLMTRREFQRLIYDDSELTADEMRAAADPALTDPERWGAPGMDDYNDYDAHRNTP